MLLLDVFKS
jgi:hypothetical protein